MRAPFNPVLTIPAMKDMAWELAQRERRRRWLKRKSNKRNTQHNNNFRRTQHKAA